MQLLKAMFVVDNCVRWNEYTRRTANNPTWPTCWLPERATEPRSAPTWCSSISSRMDAKE